MGNRNRPGRELIRAEKKKEEEKKTKGRERKGK